MSELQLDVLIATDVLTASTQHASLVQQGTVESDTAATLPRKHIIDSGEDLIHEAATISDDLIEAEADAPGYDPDMLVGEVEAHKDSQCRMSPPKSYSA